MNNVCQICSIRELTGGMALSGNFNVSIARGEIESEFDLTIRACVPCGDDNCSESARTIACEDFALGDVAVKFGNLIGSYSSESAAVKESGSRLSLLIVDCRAKICL